MGKHSSGKNGFEQDKPSVLAITDAARNRLTAGITLSIRNKYFPTDLRINYEKNIGITTVSPQKKANKTSWWLNL